MVLCLVLTTSVLAKEKNEYNVWTNIVYGTTFSDSWDFCMQLEKKNKDGEWEQVIVIEELENGRKLNQAAYLFRAASSHRDCKKIIKEKVEEWKETIFEKPYIYQIEWNQDWHNRVDEGLE